MTVTNRHDSVVATELNNNVEANSLPQVCLPGNGTTLSDAAEAMAMAYRKQSDPEKWLYNRGDAVCRIDKTQNGMLNPSILSAKRACSDFEQVAILGKQKKSKTGEGTTAFEPDVCSTDTASKILVASTFLDALPKIHLVTNAPVIIGGEENQCRIINTYDEASGIYPGGKTVEEVSLADAVQLIKEAISDFNFQSEGDKSRAIAALLTPALTAGKVLDAMSPLMMLEADKSQSGKGYFTKLLSAIYNESPLTVTQRKGGAGSFDENFDAALCSRRQFIVLDNLRGKLDSPQIEAFLTSERYMARMPYAPQVELDPRRYFIMATSNNFELTVDMANRSNIIRIRKQEMGTYKFLSFPEGDICSHIKATQPRYLGAIFSVIREWIGRGKPRQENVRHDFREWCGALDWIVQNVFEGVPLMHGYHEAKMATLCPNASWFNGLYRIVSTMEELERPLTAQRLAEFCELDGIELPGSLGTPWKELDNNGKKQVYSQVARRFANLFNKFGDTTEIELGDFALRRKNQKMTYSSGKTENATVYLFSALA